MHGIEVIDLSHLAWSNTFSIFSSALYGVLFPRDKEAAFANYRMWESLGFVIGFAYSNFICLDFKIYILLAMLVLTTVTYPIVEYHEWCNPTQGHR